MTKIAICLATYNGMPFLPAQLASIKAQSVSDWRLYVRDDGSTDGTPQVLSAFAKAHPGQVTLIQTPTRRLGAKENFCRLMEVTSEPYIAFADQDDIWRPDKLAEARRRLQAIEAAHPPGKPAMVHADRRLIDDTGTQIAPSYWQSRKVRPERFRPETHFTFCLAAGSTMLVNRALVDLALPVPEAARMHDTWLELVAQMLGVVGVCDAIAVDFRRHGGNASGGPAALDRPEARRALVRAKRLVSGLEQHRAVCAAYLKQAQAFRARFKDRLGPGALRRVTRLTTLPAYGAPRRMATLALSRAAPPSLARAMVFVALSRASSV